MSESIEQPLDLDAEVVRLNRFSRYIVQPVLIAALVSAMGSAVISLLALGSESLLPWQPFRFGLLFVVAEGVYTTIWLKQPGQRSMNKRVYRTAEIIFIVIILRLLTWGAVGDWPQWSELIDYLRSPVETFLDPFFTLILAVNLACWGWACSVTDNFQKMALDPSEVRFYATPPRDRPQFSLPNTPFRSLAFEQFGRHWIIGGVVIAFLAAVSTTDLAALRESGWPTINELNLAPGMLASLLIYFGAGLMLISQARLAILNARWLFGGQEKTVAIEQNWSRQVAILILAIGVIAAFLPLGSTNLIGRLLEIILFYIVQLVGLAWYFVIWLLSLFVSPSEEPIPEQELMEQAPIQPPALTDVPPPPPAEPGFPVFGVLFWFLAIVVGLIAITFFLRERGIKLKLPQLGNFLAVLKRWWQSIWRIAVHQLTDFRDAIVTRLVQDDVAADASQPWRFIRLNSLNPRQKLRYFYLSTIQRADKGSFARWDSATPLEYAEELKVNMPDVGSEIDAVTAGFLQARYDRKDILAAEVERIEPQWKALRRALRNRSAQSPSDRL